MAIRRVVRRASSSHPCNHAHSRPVRALTCNHVQSRAIMRIHAGLKKAESERLLEAYNLAMSTSYSTATEGSKKIKQLFNLKG